MVRKHGWKLPFHTLQVVAITVFCLLVVAFYIFLAPFLGGHIWEYALIGIYSPVALIVFILYIRCTAINPADPGILSKFDHLPTYEANTKPEGGSTKDFPGEFGSRIHSSPSLESRSSLAATNSNKHGSIQEGLEINDPVPRATNNVFCNVCGMIMCGLFVHEDCQKDYSSDEQEANGEDALYCTLCKAEVRKFSKHCRSCDKCVDGFDHHCRWLNNCVGRKNYYTFICLMAISLVWLAIEAGVGFGVFVRCFVNKRSMEADIIDRLGNGFSRAPFAAVVAVCTAVSILASVPLGELFFFHMILIKKGITTYEFVVAMRAMSEAPPGGASVDEELPNIIYSPSGSTTTGFSGGSSLGHHYKGAWCTPPRVFVDYQDEVIPHLEPGMIPSSVDPDSAGQNKVPKKPVKRSAWKLAKLDPNEAMKAAAKARASSSVLRPIEGCSRLPDVEYSSSGNMSIQSNISSEISGGINNSSSSKEIKNEFRMSSSRNLSALSQGSRDEYESGTHSLSSISSPSHIQENVTLSPLPRIHEPVQFKPGIGSSFPPMANPAQPSTSKDPFSSMLGLDEKTAKRESSTDPLLLSAPVASASLLRDMRRASVVWDQEAGRYVSVPATTSTETRNQHRLTLPTTRFSSNANNVESVAYNSSKRPIILHRPNEEPSSSTMITAAPPGEPLENLVYTGESIFFGGPLLSGMSSRDAGVRTEKEQVFRPAPQRFGPPVFSSHQDSRFKRDAGSNQLPVFAPGGVGQGFSVSGPR